MRGREGAPSTGAPIPILSADEADAWVDGLVASRRAPPDLPEVEEIFARVRRDGDAAVLELTERFDGVRPEALRVPRERCAEALAALPVGLRGALERSMENVRRFHAAQRRRGERVRIAPGIVAWREFRPLERVGLYVPGGKAAYPSSLVMCAVPARLAGCGRVLACCPPGPDGLPAAAVLATAALVEVDLLIAAGGVQAVAAFACGTESIPAVDKIVGPGGEWVTAAKLTALRHVAIDMPAGPSEVLAWADEVAPDDWVAAELVAQAEHGPDSLCVGILPTVRRAEAVRAALARRLDTLPRAGHARASLAASALLVSADEERALRWIDALAPEHLALMRDDAEAVARRVSHAGCVFVGPYAAVAAGDYASGTNHTIPTGGRARGASALSLDDFGRWVTFQSIDRAGLEALAPTVEALAEWEGLSGHAASIAARRRDAAPSDEGAHDDGARPCSRGPQPRAHLLDLEPYVSDRARHVGEILLDANEIPFGSPVPELDPELHRYPDPESARLREALAASLGTTADRLRVANGSDEILDLLLRAFVEPAEPVVIATPTYGVYAGRARVSGALIRQIPLDAEFDLDLERAVEAARDARLVFLCSPNNPTGTRLSSERVLGLAEASPALIVVDEAYVEFASAPSLVRRIDEPANLAVVRTFSKARGLAGARVGYLAAAPEVLRGFDAVALPYPLSSLAALAARRTLERADRTAAWRDRVIAERERVRGRLEALGLRPLPSEANFVLFFVDDPGRVQRELAARFGVVVRDRSRLPRLAGALRVTIGTEQENDRFLAGLEELARPADAGSGGPDRRDG